jgi:hypothetical protein
MKRTTGFVVAIALFALFAIPAIAAPKKDKVTGHGINAAVNNPAEFHINAESGPLGEDPHGTVRFKTIENKAEQKGPVRCLRVDGNRAVIGVEWNKLKNQDNGTNKGAFVFVEDNGKADKDDPLSDQMMTVGIRQIDTIPGENDCPAPEDIADRTIQKGDLKVVDAQPPVPPAV